MSTMPFSLVVAIDNQLGIGKDGTLPWHIPTDLKHFKNETCQTEKPGQQNVVLMGRKTWESIPEKFRPLPGRINMVLTRRTDYTVPEGVVLATSFEEALDQVQAMASTARVDQLFAIGGAEIFKEALGHDACHKLIVTHILKDFSCDTFFPPFLDQFEQDFFSSCHNENDITFYFANYKRK